MRKVHKLKCLVCKEGERLDGEKVCSIICKQEYQKSRVILTCPICNIERECHHSKKFFESCDSYNLFCSPECKTIFANANPKHKKPKKKVDIRLSRRIDESRYYDQLPSHIHKRFNFVRG